MFSLHAIAIRQPHREGGPAMCRTFFGKGSHDEAAVRARLLPEHGDAEIYLGRPVEARFALDVRYLILLEQLRKDYPSVTSAWWPLDGRQAPLMMEAAMQSMASDVDCSSSAEGMIRYRELLGIDQGVMAAMLSTERTRVHRLEQGKSKFTFDDYRRLRYWADRLSVMKDFIACFPEGVQVPFEKRHIPDPELTA